MTFHIDNVFYPAGWKVDITIPNSNFLEELKLIDSDRRKICYGVNIHILQSGQLIVLFLRQARFAVFVSCVWKFSVVRVAINDSSINLPNDSPPIQRQQT
ncbi:hypothetical protein LOAG_13490 [Loa loa]|uniref:Uncharacterized protein n=1 Tax=Loa loa TaxID=7209 RepID=A0A1S0TJE5_LOALO|nr:hypothetical protein LOAG_13490 [Loa loa]EFO15025.1 hypothetical protein LOAG_13490 [Loa loa]